jgi:biopolymer transport protein ExbB/TolQ
MLLHLLTQLALASDDPGSNFDFLHMWNESGFIAKSVIVMLAVMALATVVVAIERYIAFARARKQSMMLAGEIVGALQAGDIARALAMTKNEDYKVSYLAALLRGGLAELDERCDTFGVKNSQRAVDKAIGEELSKLRRFMTILATVGSTAPFVGLFGTTFGVINAFASMGDGGGLASISTGISEALITTGVGIGVAVLGVWVFNFFNGKVDKVAEELSTAESDFLVWAEKMTQPSFDGAPTNGDEITAEASK